MCDSIPEAALTCSLFNPLSHKHTHKNIFLYERNGKAFTRSRKKVWLLAKATQQFHQSHSGAAPELDWSGSLLLPNTKKPCVCGRESVCASKRILEAETMNILWGKLAGLLGFGSGEVLACFCLSLTYPSIQPVIIFLWIHHTKKETKIIWTQSNSLIFFCFYPNQNFFHKKFFHKTIFQVFCGSFVKEVVLFNINLAFQPNPSWHIVKVNSSVHFFEWIKIFQWTIHSKFDVVLLNHWLISSS